MAPAESYLDPMTSEFSLNLNHKYPEWQNIQPNFPYHGKNIYAYLLAKYNETYFDKKSKVPTFDFITIQLYEGI